MHRQHAAGVRGRRRGGRYVPGGTSHMSDEALEIVELDEAILVLGSPKLKPRNGLKGVPLRQPCPRSCTARYITFEKAILETFDIFSLICVGFFQVQAIYTDPEKVALAVDPRT